MRSASAISCSMLSDSALALGSSPAAVSTASSALPLKLLRKVLISNMNFFLHTCLAGNMVNMRKSFIKQVGVTIKDTLLAQQDLVIACKEEEGTNFVVISDDG